MRSITFLLGISLIAVSLDGGDEARAELPGSRTGRGPTGQAITPGRYRFPKMPNELPPQDFSTTALLENHIGDKPSCALIAYFSTVLEFCGPSSTNCPDKRSFIPDERLNLPKNDQERLLYYSSARLACETLSTGTENPTSIPASLVGAPNILDKAAALKLAARLILRETTNEIKRRGQTTLSRLGQLLQYNAHGVGFGTVYSADAGTGVQLGQEIVNHANVLGSFCYAGASGNVLNPSVTKTKYALKTHGCKDNNSYSGDFLGASLSLEVLIAGVAFSTNFGADLVNAIPGFVAWLETLDQDSVDSLLVEMNTTEEKLYGFLESTIINHSLPPSQRQPYSPQQVLRYIVLAQVINGMRATIHLYGQKGLLTIVPNDKTLGKIHERGIILTRASTVLISSSSIGDWIDANRPTLKQFLTQAISDLGLRSATPPLRELVAVLDQALAILTGCDSDTAGISKGVSLLPIPVAASGSWTYYTLVHELDLGLLMKNIGGFFKQAAFDFGMAVADEIQALKNNQRSTVPIPLPIEFYLLPDLQPRDIPGILERYKWGKRPSPKDLMNRGRSSKQFLALRKLHEIWLQIEYPLLYQKTNMASVCKCVIQTAIRAEAICSTLRSAVNSSGFDSSDREVLKSGYQSSFCDPSTELFESNLGRICGGRPNP